MLCWKGWNGWFMNYLKWFFYCLIKLLVEFIFVLWINVMVM